MEVFNIPDQGLAVADMFLIQGAESNPQYSGQLEQFEGMYNEGTPEYIVDQGLYYPAPNSYGYVCTGFESSGEFEDYPRIFGLDGQDMQYTGGANESAPFVYYTPSYGYGQSPYNPYNPYIPGAIIGMDGSYVAPQYYTLPSYENPISSPAYVPMVLQSGPDIMANGIADSFVPNAVSVNPGDGPAFKHDNKLSKSPISSQTLLGDTATRKNSFARVSEGSRTIPGSSKQPMPSMESGSFPSIASSQVRRARGPQGTENGLNEKVPSGSDQLKVDLPPSNGLSGFESSNRAPASAHKVRPKLLYGRVSDDINVGSDALGEQNRGPRTNKFKNQLVVKAYTTRAGSPDANGNITIYMDQYNKGDFPVDKYVNAKFFVIKSYSEDDVHKSIKYNVWSSTPNGNKKLNSAYEDAQRIAAGDSRGCSVFLFFSVNASGQFCGVAEMTGPVDFHEDMDFWQQDKWSGSFPVKWHIIKDLPNPNIRHIILENNENKSVTNSRDTQEICYKKGLEMLQIFKNYTSKTSLLDDFMYYENRQRILQEERSRLLIKSYENPYIVPLVDAPRKFHSISNFPFVGDANGAKPDVNILSVLNKNKGSADEQSKCSEKNQSVRTGQVSINTNIKNSMIVEGNGQVSAGGEPKYVDELKISSLTINSKEPESDSSLPDTFTSTEANTDVVVDVVTIGSMPIKVNATEPSFLTVGTILLDPRALHRD